MRNAKCEMKIVKWERGRGSMLIAYRGEASSDLRADTSRLPATKPPSSWTRLVFPTKVIHTANWRDPGRAGMTVNWSPQGGSGAGMTCYKDVGRSELAVVLRSRLSGALSIVGLPSITIIHRHPGRAQVCRQWKFTPQTGRDPGPRGIEHCRSYEQNLEAPALLVGLARVAAHNDRWL